VGVGFWGASWIPVVRRSRHWKLAALVDTDPHALRRSAPIAGVDESACFASLGAAARAIESDAALVVVPPKAHAPLALEALEHGLHCLIEKPFANTLEEARLIVERAAEAERIVMVSQQYRHRPGARTVADMVRNRTLGRLGSAYVTFSHELAAPGFQLEIEEPLLWDMAIHHFDLVRGILGIEPARVRATTSNPWWSPFRGNAAATVVLEAEDGASVTYAGTWAPRGLHTGWDGVWDILCEGGSIRWDGDDVLVKPLERPLLAKIQKRVLRREWKGQRVKPLPVPEPDRLGSLAELSAAIRDGREPETSGRDNVRSLALVVAAVESARRDATVDVSELG
jgi:predicted dehydrogenase